MTEIGNVTVRVDAVITDEQYREAMGAIRAANERMDLIEAENSKLRELVRDMYRRFHGVVIENWSYSSEDFYTYERRMRELGVEMGYGDEG